jgi:hypothetical protein
MKTLPTKRGGAPVRVGSSFLVFALACLVLSDCAPRSAEGPGGSAKEAGERFRSDRYLVGSSCVPLSGDLETDRLEADRRARAEVAKQLEVKVVQVVDDLQREEQKNEQRTAAYAVSVRTQEFVDETLKGVRIVERRKSEEQGLACSVAVLDKSAMAFQIREQMQRDLQEIEALLTSARSAKGAGSPPVQALRAYALAMLSTDRLAVNEKMLLTLGYRPPQVPSRIGIRQEWTEVLEGIQLVRTGGEAQRARPGSPLAEPLALAARGRSGEPVANLPVKALRAPRGSEMQRTATTGADGRAEFQVYRVRSNRIALEETAIGIDWGGLLGAEARSVDAPRPWDGWDGREVVFTYRIPVPSDYRVGVAVFESGSGRPLRDSPIQSSVLAGLQEAGFKTRDLHATSVFRKRPDPGQARQRLEGEVDILVVGDVSLRFSSETSGLTFYRARGVVKGLALDTGLTVVTLDLEAKGGGLDEDKAVRKALRNLAKRLEHEIAPALEGVLE